MSTISLVPNTLSAAVPSALNGGITSSLESAKAKANVLVEALPYINQFQGTVAVIKVGGSILDDVSTTATLIQDIVWMQRVGIQPILIHGGGPEINDWLAQTGHTPQFIQGLRKTDEKTLEIAQMVLCGKINKHLVQTLGQGGAKALGLSGQDNHLIVAEKKHPIFGMDLGHVGSVKSINTEFIGQLLQLGIIPVISPIGVGDDGQAYNINADEVAVAVATHLTAQKLVFLSDVPGVLQNAEDPESLISKLTVSTAHGHMGSGLIHGGMIPKVQAACQAITDGVAQVHFLDGRKPHALLLEIFTQDGIGTMVVEDHVEPPIELTKD